MDLVSFFVVLLPSILGFFVYCCIYASLTNKKFAFSFKNTLFIIFFSVLLTFDNLLNNVYIYPFLNAIIITLCFKCVFKGEWFRTFVNSLLVVMFAFLLEPILSVVLSFIFSNVIELNNMVFMKLIFSIIFCFNFYFIFKISFIIEICQMIFKPIKSNKKLIIALLFLTILAYYFDLSYSLNYFDIRYYLLVLIMIAFTIYFSRLAFKSMFNNQLYDVINKHLVNNINLYQKQSDDFRLLKHNLKNDLYSIKLSNDDNRNQIIDEVMEKYNMYEPTINNISNVPTGLQGLIVLKFEEAKSKNIDAWFENNSNDLEKINNRIFLDLCNVVSICIDNAIESAEVSDEKVLLIEIGNREDNIEIKIINSFVNDIDLDKLGDKDYSTKNRNSGLGLNYIYNLNKDIEIVQKIVDNLFFTTISIQRQ